MGEQRWKHIWITITPPKGSKARRRLRPALIVAPGLAITKLAPGVYTVTHVSSGLRVSPGLSLRIARLRADYLATLADWSVGGEELRADADLALAVRESFQGPRGLSGRVRRSSAAEKKRRARVRRAAWMKGRKPPAPRCRKAIRAERFGGAPCA